MLTPLRKFIQLEGAPGIILFICALLALVVDNSPLHLFYQNFFETPVAIHMGQAVLSKPLVFWINEGLMSIFFLLVGLEIKREILIGELNSVSKLTLPAIAAIGGIVFPALIYVFFNWGHAQDLRGWAIPTATDIAFALGILYLLGARIPTSLKVFLTAVAIFDDLAAILIIAIFYASHISLMLLLAGGACLMVLMALNRGQVYRLTPYVIIGFFLWLFVLESGVHATFAAVLVAFTIPLYPKHIKGQPRVTFAPRHSPSHRLEKRLHPWVSYFVLPVFAFANAGVSFKNLQWDSLISPVSLGILLGLFIGKQLGVFASVWVTVKLGLAKLPYQTSWSAIYGVALLCGVGFTMSLFIGTLAFNGVAATHGILLRSGVLLGSLLSGLFGFLILFKVYHVRKGHLV